jgi:hypothetical protein
VLGLSDHAQKLEHRRRRIRRRQDPAALDTIVERADHLAERVRRVTRHQARLRPVCDDDDVHVRAHVFEPARDVAPHVLDVIGREETSIDADLHQPPNPNLTRVRVHTEHANMLARVSAV